MRRHDMQGAGAEANALHSECHLSFLIPSRRKQWAPVGKQLWPTSSDGFSYRPIEDRASEVTDASNSPCAFLH